MAPRPSIFCLGTNHKIASVDLRETLFLDSEQIQQHQPDIQKKFGFDELMVISTCNRLEIFGVLEDENYDQSKIVDAFLELQQLCGHQTKLSSSDISKFLYNYRGDEACQHAFKVASSLDSLVVGETQITGQFKSSMELARDSSTLGPVLDRLGQEALSTAKKVRSQTEIGKRTVSIASAAAELVESVFEDIKNHRLLIVGAGEMARIVSQHLVKHKPKSVGICNRSQSRALELISDIGEGEYIPLADLYSHLHHFDIIVTATNAPGYILESDEIKKTVFVERERSSLMVDISMPRNIDPNISELEEVFLFDIDDLKQVVDSNISARKKEAKKAEDIVSDAVKRFALWFESQSLKPLMKKSGSFYESIVHEVFAKTESKSTIANSDASVKAELETLKASLIQTLTNQTNQNLKQIGQNPKAQSLFDIVSALLKSRSKK